MTRIEGPGRSGAVGKADKAKKAGGANGASFADLLSTDEADGGGSVSAPLGAGAVSALLTLQAATEHATERDSRRRAVQYGDDLLDELDNLRLSLLTGNYTLNSLQNLLQRIDQRRLTIDDPHLTELIDEIEMRARIELAKYGF